MGPTKFTAQQVEQDCPTQLQDLAKNIATHLDKARKAEEKAQQHYIAAAKYLAEAQAACDESGFKAFQEKFCPDIGRSRAYELLAVVRGKKTLGEVKDSTRERQRRHRAKKAEQKSVTVTDPAAATSVEAPKPEEPTQPPWSVALPDKGLRDFTNLVARLLQIAKKPSDFTKTPHSAEELRKLVTFFTELARLKETGLKEAA
jgi:hypothetical protein